MVYRGERPHFIVIVVTTGAKTRNAEYSVNSFSKIVNSVQVPV